MAAAPTAEEAPDAAGTTADDTTMADVSALSAGTKAQKSRELFSCTISKPAFAYAHLELVAVGAQTAAPALDELQVRSHLSAALSLFLGVTGAAIPVDILKVERRQCWVRVPRDDLAPFTAAVTAWPGVEDEHAQAVFHVRAAGNWLGSLVGRGEQQKLWGS